jgi:hypothetical protein
MTTIYDEAVQSVKRRGFYDNISSPRFENPMLMAQYARLIEEIGEYEEAIRGCASEDSIVNELADVVIVAAQMGHLTGADFVEWREFENGKINGCALVQLAGQWARYTRKGQNAKASVALLNIVRWCRIVASQRGIASFDAVIRQKLATDETRGYQHSGGY